MIVLANKIIGIIKAIRQFISLLLISFILISCGQTSQNVHVRTLSAEEYYPIALKIGQEWKSDAYLESIDSDFITEEEIEKQLEIYFSFESPTNDFQSLLIKFTEDLNEPKIQVVEHSNPISVRNPIELKDWPVNNIKALQVAQDNGGNEFLSKYDSETANLFIRLEERRPIMPGVLPRWRVSYANFDAGKGVDISIDPLTGEVIETKWQ